VMAPRKLAFAITEADFAVWLESDDKWNIRMKARPMRTDAISRTLEAWPSTAHSAVRNCCARSHSK